MSDEISQDTVDLLRKNKVPTDAILAQQAALAQQNGSLPLNTLDGSGASIWGYQPGRGFGPLDQYAAVPGTAPPAPSAGTNGVTQPTVAPVDASGRSTMPINADPSLYSPGTPGAAANQHFGPGPPTRLTPQQPTGGRASTITPKAEGGAALGSIISFQPSNDFTQQTGFSAEDYDRYRGYLAKVESERYDQPPSRTGKADPPWVAGRYQMGPGEIAQAASELGIPNPSIQQFLASPELQEQLFQQYTLDHHRELMQYPMYANGDAATRMALLAGRHLGGFDTWMKGGDPQDINGTHTSKYINGMYAVATGKVDGIAHPGAVGASYSTDPAIQSVQTQLQQYRADATRLLQTELEEFNKLKAGSPETDAQLRKLADRQIADLDAERQMVMSPPIEKPADIFANFGSLATVVGVLGGMLSRRGMAASLDAAGAAMEAINTNNHEQWKDAFDTWKARTTLMANLIGHESAIYKDILDNKRLDWDEKLGLLQTRFGIEQNILGQQYAAAGDMAKIIELTQKQQEIADKHRETVAKAEVEENKRDAENAAKKAAQEDDKQWLADHPEAKGVVPAGVTADNLARRLAEMKEAGKTGQKVGDVKTYNVIPEAGEGQAIGQVRLQKGAKPGEWYDVDGHPYTPPQGYTLDPVKAQAGRVATQMANSMIASGNLATASLQNLTELPGTASTGWFMGSETHQPGDLSGWRSVLAHKFTSAEDRAMQETATGIQREMAQLEGQGRATGMVGLTRVNNILIPQAGDTLLDRMRKLAEIRQIIETNLQAVAHQGNLNPIQQKFVEDILTRVAIVYPYTVHDVNELQKATPSRFGGFAKDFNAGTIMEASKRIAAQYGGAQSKEADLIKNAPVVTEEEWKLLPKGALYRTGPDKPPMRKTEDPPGGGPLGIPAGQQQAAEPAEQPSEEP